MKITTFALTTFFVVAVECFKKSNLYCCRTRSFTVDGLYEDFENINVTQYHQRTGFCDGFVCPRTQKVNLNHNFARTSMISSILGQVKSKKCKSQILNFVNELQNHSFWAVEMFDASSKFPSGLVISNTYQFGNYDQCINIISEKHSVKGKYCLANVQFSPTKKKYPPFYNIHLENEFSLNYDPYNSVLEKFRVTKDLRKKRRDTFQSGICIPDSCSAQDVEIILNNLILPKVKYIGYNVTIKVAENFCSTKEVKTIDSKGKILGYTIASVIIFVILCTVWDCVNKKHVKSSSELYSYLEVFSLSKNISSITSEIGDGDVNVFNGMKSLSMILIIMGHRCMATCGGPFFNPQFLEERYRKMRNILLLNGTLIVDTFFLIGGFLTFLTLFKEYQKRKKFNFFKIYLYRWLRITPVYLLVIFFYAYILEHLGSGPHWAIKVNREAERCRKNWWTNFLFINNYVNTESLCMFQSWYVTCDMHFILLAPIIVQIITKSPKKGLLFLASLIICSLMSLFLVTYYNKYDGVLRVYITTFEDIAKSFTFNKVYIKTHNRATPYFSGMAAAYVYIKLKHVNHKFTLLQVWICSGLATIFAITAICSAWFFYIPGREYNALENALYASLHRLLWAISMSWIAVAGGTKSFGVIEPILSQKFFIPLSKLSYSAFLVHGAIQIYTSATLRVPEDMNFAKLYWMTCGDVIFSYFFAFLLYVFFEAPIKGVQKQLFSKKI